MPVGQQVLPLEEENRSVLGSIEPCTHASRVASLSCTQREHDYGSVAARARLSEAMRGTNRQHGAGLLDRSHCKLHQARISRHRNEHQGRRGQGRSTALTPPWAASLCDMMARAPTVDDSTELTCVANGHEKHTSEPRRVNKVAIQWSPGSAWALRACWAVFCRTGGPAHTPQRRQHTASE